MACPAMLIVPVIALLLLFCSLPCFLFMDATAFVKPPSYGMLSRCRSSQDTISSYSQGTMPTF
eukprot:2776250-Amphidinium_carterae.1